MSTDIGALIAQLDERLKAVERASRLSSASLDDTALEVRDDTGSLRAIVGQQADGTSGVNVVNGPTPPTPSAPTVEPALAALTVTWDGTFSDAQAAPLDWMRVEVHVGATAGFTPDQGTLRDTIETAQGGTVVIPLPYTEWHIKLRSRTTAGVAGPATTAVAGTPRQAEAADIQAGAITADLIAVDALTGKTITGGLITGSEIQTAASGERITINEDASNMVLVYDDTGRAVGELSGRGLLLEGTNGALIWLDPDSTYPNLRLTIDDQSNEAVINVVETTAGAADLGLNSGTFTGSSYADMKWRTFFGKDFWAAERLRDSHNATVIGGRVRLAFDGGALQYMDTDNPTQTTTLNVAANTALLDQGRLWIDAPASASTALLVETPSGHTGNLFRIRHNSVDRLYVSTDGALAVVGRAVITPDASANSAVYVNGASGHTGNLLRLQLNAVDRFSVSAAGDVAVVGDLSVQGRDTGRGLIGSIIRTTNLTSISTTNLVAMTVPSMTWKTGRAYRVDMTALMSSTTAGTYAVYQLVKGTTATGTVVRGQIRQVLAGTASVNTHQECSIVITNATGADITTALTLTVSVAAGTGQLSASSATPASMTVTDVGLAADWPGTPIT